MNLQNYGEDHLVKELLKNSATGRGVRVGPGDDCAVIGGTNDEEWQLLKTDVIVEGIHFLSDAAPENIGWKAMARPLSDIAAMSGAPKFALITIAIAQTAPVSFATAIYRGINKAAARFGVQIVGGETSRSPRPLFLCVMLTGRVERQRCVLRSGGKAGDLLYVTGQLGGSLGGRHLDFVPRIVEARWLSTHFNVHAMIDLSDGLGADLPRLAQASRTGFKLDESSIPLARGCSIENAISDGEDYELLFAIAAEDAERLEKKWARKFAHLPLTRIGELTAGGGQRLHGYDHFAKRRRDI